jgi:hypothetical protein
LGLSIRPDPLAGARAWKQLLVARQFETQLALSVGLGLAPGEVRKTLSLLELPPEIQGIIESNRALSALDTLYYIRRVFCRDGLDAARFLALRACRENLGVRDVRREAGGVRKIEVSAVKVAGVLGEMSVCVESGTLQLNFEDLSVNSLDLVQKALRHLA